MPAPDLGLHFVNIGPDGTFKPSGAVHRTPADVDRILGEMRGAAKVAVHFHGGLVSEAKGLALAARLIPTYEQGGAYPVTVVWETGLLETVSRTLAQVSRTKLFDKLVDLAIRQAAKRLGAGVGARGPGQEMSLTEVRAARASDAEMEQMDIRAKGGADVAGDVDALAGDIEADLQADVEADPELVALLESSEPDRAAIDDAVLAEVDEAGQRGVLTTITAARLLLRIVVNTLRRFAARRDHGVIATVVEEVLRAAYVAQLGAWIWTAMKTAAADMWKPNAGSA